MRQGIKRAAKVLGMTMAAFVLLANGPALAAEFPQEKESCEVTYDGHPWEGCYDMLKSTTLTPGNGTMTVSWEPVRQTITFYCPPNWALSDCPVTGYLVKASYDPVTKTGGGTCTTGRNAPHSCTITGLRNGVQYTFRIASKIEGWAVGSFIWSPEIGPATPCCSVAAPPSEVQATQVGAALDVTWSPSKDWGGATTLKYVVTTDPPSVSCTAEILTCRLEGLDYAKAYKVLVASKNDAGESTPVASAATYTIPTGPPDSPTISGVKFGAGSGAKVSWTPPAKTGGLPVTKYTVTSQPGGASCTASNGTSCTIAGLNAGKAYSFTATAANAKGTSKASAPSVAGKLNGPGVQVQAPSASAAGTTATVAWKPPTAKTGGALVSYVVKASGGAGTCTTKNTRCAISGLRPGGNYQFAVTTVRTGGASSPVSTAAITMPAPPIPVAPKPTAELS